LGYSEAATRKRQDFRYGMPEIFMLLGDNLFGNVFFKKQKNQRSGLMTSLTFATFGSKLLEKVFPMLGQKALS